MCSTPFGIIGIFTENEVKYDRDYGYVLNAFRHHWNLHLSRCQSFASRSYGAQRLSASLESSQEREKDKKKGKRKLLRLIKTVRLNHRLAAFDQARVAFSKCGAALQVLELLR